MTIPLDRLYHYIEDVARNSYSDCLLIYRFWPHGSKKLQDLDVLNPLPDNFFMCAKIYCNDQEPLHYDLYEAEAKTMPDTEFIKLKKTLFGSNVRIHENIRWEFDVNNLAFLIHSEKRSAEIQKYQNKNFVPVYYWNHAILSRDWFRYAEYIEQKKNSQKTFLIYNRAWSGTREYRLKFADLLIESNLVNSCQTTINACDPESNTHYSNHNFKNSAWKPLNILENYFLPNQINSDASADFKIVDYENTDIEVVLETLFDDQRLHLTEKILRPIACGQPFILAGTMGSLAYLHEYGFQTFNDVWNEDYDLCTDPQERILKIVDLMKSIKQWSADTRFEKMAQAQKIAEYNKKYFFSKEFFELIVKELQSNFASAVAHFKENNGYNIWIEKWNQWLTYPEMLKWLKDRQNSMPLNLDYLISLNQMLDGLKSKNT